jgi:hypothetical protein
MERWRSTRAMMVASPSAFLVDARGSVRQQAKASKTMVTRDASQDVRNRSGPTMYPLYLSGRAQAGGVLLESGR